MTFLCLLDETGREVRRDKWFLYAACATEMDRLKDLHRDIIRIRNRAKFRPKVQFKWTRPASQTMAAEVHDNAVNELLDASSTHGVRMFIAMTPSMVTIRTARNNTSIRYGVGYVFTMLQQFLTKEHSHGIAALDTFAGGTSLPIVEEVLREGLPAGVGNSKRRRRFNRILLSGVTSVRANALAPLIDVTLGAFGYCVMCKTTTWAKGIYPRLKLLIYRDRQNGTPWNHGLRIRPIDIEDPECAQLALDAHRRLVELGEVAAPAFWIQRWQNAAS